MTFWKRKQSTNSQPTQSKQRHRHFSITKLSHNCVSDIHKKKEQKKIIKILLFNIAE